MTQHTYVTFAHHLTRHLSSLHIHSSFLTQAPILSHFYLISMVYICFQTQCIKTIVSPTPWVTSQEANITRHTPEATCWLWLRCWSNNVANSHLSPGPFDCRVLCYCLVPQCSYPPYWPTINETLRIVTGCLRPTPANNLPILAGIQPAELRRRGATLSLGRLAMEPGHLLHSAITRPPGAAAQRLKSRHPFVPAAQQLISFSDNNNKRSAQWADRQCNAEWADNPTRLRTSIPDTGSPPWNDHPQKNLGPAQPPPHQCWTFPLVLVLMGMASSAACECGAEEQTVGHVVLHCPLHRPRHGLHGLTVLDDETIEWLLNTCPEI